MHTSSRRTIYQNWPDQANIWPHYQGLGSIPHPEYFHHCRLNSPWFGPIVFLRAQRGGALLIAFVSVSAHHPPTGLRHDFALKRDWRRRGQQVFWLHPCAVRPDWWTQAKAGTTNRSITSPLLLEGIKHSSCLNQVMNAFNLPVGKWLMVMLQAWLKQTKVTGHFFPRESVPLMAWCWQRTSSMQKETNKKTKKSLWAKQVKTKWPRIFVLQICKGFGFIRQKPGICYHFNTLTCVI